MPALGLGTWELKGNDCVAAVRMALQAGYRHIDTAEMYGNETEIGQALAASGIPREELFLTTKVWTNHHREKDFIQAAEDSLKRLKTDHVDLLLIHWPNEAVPLEETLRALCKLAQQGKTLAIGVSNFSLELLKKAQTLADRPIACDQVPFSLEKSQSELLPYAFQRKTVVCAYSPLGRGKFLGRKELAEIGKKYGKTPAQVALRWLIQQGGVAAIPKAAGSRHLRENIGIFDFDLDPSALKELRRL